MKHDAIDMLKTQHREVKAMFRKIEKADQPSSKERLFVEIADALAVHATIEEKHFYPAVRAKRTEDILLESLEEHLGIKRVIADIMKIDSSDETFDAKVKVLIEQVEHHAGEEEDELFPKVRKVLPAEQLQDLAAQMQSTMDALEAKGNPRQAVPKETAVAASLK